MEKITLDDAVTFMGILKGQRDKAFDLIHLQQDIIRLLLKFYIKNYNERNNYDWDKITELMKEAKIDEQMLIVNMVTLKPKLEEYDYSDIDIHTNVNGLKRPY